MDTAQRVWKYLKSAGMTSAGTAGMMGNIRAESGMIANRVEDLCLKRLKEVGKYYTNATYTAFVDEGTITKEQFLHPLPGKQYGYGLCQWTSPSRKAKLYDLCKKKHVSIGDLETQLQFLVEELKTSFTGVWEVLCSTDDIVTASNKVLIHFEQPDDTSEPVRRQRQKYSEEYYKEFVTGGVTMTIEQAITKVVDIALAEVGYKEKQSASNLYDKSANAGSNNYTKYGKEMHDLQPSNMDYPAAWCDAFVDWCFYKAFGASLAKKMLCGTFDDYTVNSANYYKNAGRWTKTASRGYQVFFRNSSGICHTGLVYKVADGKVYTVEGNAGNKVQKKSYSTADSYIAGYGMPKYDLVATESVPATSSYKYTGECSVTAVQLVRGDFGEAVKVLQTLLNLKNQTGKDGKALLVDGQFGEYTEYAVAQLQKKCGMSNINFGTVSTLTWNVLLK